MQLCLNINETKYVLGSMKNKSLYFIKITNNKLIGIERIDIFERVRDLYFKDNIMYLFLEDTASIGIINF